jgi:hypothetical protein
MSVDQSRCKLAITFILFLLIPSNTWAESRPYVHRGLFFSTRPFGALAWIDVQTQPAAKGREFIYDLSESSCHSLPARDTYWFLINHRNPNEVANVGYFAVRIIGQAMPGTVSEAVRVHRNDGWVTDDKKPLPAGPPDSDQPSLGIGEFVKFHDDNANPNIPAKKRLSDLADLIGTWHARPEPDMPSSWENRRIFASSRRLNPDQGRVPLLLGARLMKFTVTDSTVTADPVVFYVNKGDYDTFWVSVSAPNFGFEGTEKQIRIDRLCN